jgi:hypothetical protein
LGRTVRRRTNLLLFINLGNILHEIDNPLGVSPLVIVPRNQLDEILVQLDSSFSVKDRRRLVSNEIGRDDVFLGVFENTLEVGMGGLLDGILDLFVSRALLDADDEIDYGHVEGGNTEGETTL